jgi:hypothetical protein
MRNPCCCSSSGTPTPFPTPCHVASPMSTVAGAGCISSSAATRQRACACSSSGRHHELSCCGFLCFNRCCCRCFCSLPAGRCRCTAPAVGCSRPSFQPAGRFTRLTLLCAESSSLGDDLRTSDDLPGRANTAYTSGRGASGGDCCSAICASAAGATGAAASAAGATGAAAAGAVSAAASSALGPALPVGIAASAAFARASARRANLRVFALVPGCCVGAPAPPEPCGALLHS